MATGRNALGAQEGTGDQGRREIIIGLHEEIETIMIGGEIATNVTLASEVLRDLKKTRRKYSVAKSAKLRRSSSRLANRKKLPREKTVPFWLTGFI